MFSFCFNFTSEHTQLDKKMDQLFTKRNMSDLLQLKSYFFLTVNNKGIKGQTKGKTYILIFFWKKNCSSATERRDLLYIFFNWTVY